MQSFKLTPKPKNDYRLEVREIKKLCKLEKHGFRHNKIVYGFSNELGDISKLQAAGLNIEEIPFENDQMSLTSALAARGRVKSKIDHLQFDREENGANNTDEEKAAQEKLQVLNNTVQEAKTALGIDGTVKILKF